MMLVTHLQFFKTHDSDYNFHTAPYLFLISQHTAAARFTSCTLEMKNIISIVKFTAIQV